MTGDPPVDNRFYSVNPWPTSGNATWVQGPATDYRLSGHTVGDDANPSILHGHLPEIYNPSDDTWTPQTGSGWFPPFEISGDYPVQFLVPGTSIPGGGGRLLRVAPDPSTRYLDIPATGIAGSWQTAPNGDNGSYRPLTGVQYEPGKILVIGIAPGGSFATDDRARSFNALAIGTASWQECPGMELHSEPNVLVLPNGKVLVTGGGSGGNCTQIWNPAGTCGNGAWTDCLAPELIDRGYHATAMLLPDGRVLAAGGDGEAPNVYCPPYLFNFDSSPATRPTLTSAPTSVVYGEAFEIGTPTPGNIASACLIRPAAVTHSFDQNGRYVPLTFQTVPGDTVLQTWAPTDGSVAPPGDYLLFILNWAGVPAIARWIHLGDCAEVPCDAGSPPQVTDMYADVVTGDEVWMVWYAPGDDRAPLAGSYDLRLSTTGLTTDKAYATATPVSGEPAVQAQGTPVNHTVTGLTESTQYHFALKTRDGTSPNFRNWSRLSNTVTTTTMGGGPSGGGGSRAERVDEGRVAGGASATSVANSKDPLTPGAGTLSGTDAPMVGLAAVSSHDAVSGVLEAETHRTREGGWQVTLRRLTEAQGVEAPDRDAIVSQVRDAAGGWRTLGRYRPSQGQYPLGLCALRDRGRVVVPAGYVVDQVAPELRSRGQECAMSRADHSRSGAMDGAFLAEGGAVEMQIGDVLTVTYGPSGTRPGNEVSAYLQLRSSGQTAAPASATARRLGTPLPTSFALHQNQPNPFDGTTTIGFDLPVAGVVKLEVFDLLGRRVATLAEGEYPAGSHAVAWDLRGPEGVAVRPGVYVYRLQSGTFSARRKMSIVP